MAAGQSPVSIGLLVVSEHDDPDQRERQVGLPLDLIQREVAAATMYASFNRRGVTARMG